MVEHYTLDIDGWQSSCEVKLWLKQFSWGKITFLFFITKAPCGLALFSWCLGGKQGSRSLLSHKQRCSICNSPVTAKTYVWKANRHCFNRSVFMCEKGLIESYYHRECVVINSDLCGLTVRLVVFSLFSPTPLRNDASVRFFCYTWRRMTSTIHSCAPSAHEKWRNFTVSTGGISIVTSHSEYMNAVSQRLEREQTHTVRFQSHTRILT